VVYAVGKPDLQEDAMRAQALLSVSFLVLLSACASHKDSDDSYEPPSSSSVAPQTNVVVYDVEAAAGASTGSNATPEVVAGTGFAGVAPGTAFPLQQSALIIDAATGVQQDKATNLSGATLTVVDAASGRVRLRVPALNLDAEFSGSSYTETTDGRLIVLSRRVLQYVDFGYWWAEGRAGMTYAHYIAGYQTPASAVPASGGATYGGKTIGQVYPANKTPAYAGVLRGDAAVGVNFATGAVSGVLTHMVVNPDGATSAWNDVRLSGSLVRGNAMSGTTSVEDGAPGPFGFRAGAAGRFSGSFYGPAADELGAVWTLRDGAGSTAVGVLGAKLDPTAPGP
jgi:hypothetical protein